MSSTDLEYGSQRRVSKREQFLAATDETILWQVQVPAGENALKSLPGPNRVEQFPGPWRARR